MHASVPPPGLCHGLFSETSWDTKCAVSISVCVCVCVCVLCVCVCGWSCVSVCVCVQDANWWDLTQDAWRRQKEYAAAQAAKEPKTPGDSCSEDSDSEHTHSAAPSRVEAAAVGDGLSSLTLQSEPSAQSANEPVTGEPMSLLAATGQTTTM